MFLASLNDFYPLLRVGNGVILFSQSRLREGLGKGCLPGPKPSVVAPPPHPREWIYSHLGD